MACINKVISKNVYIPAENHGWKTTFKYGSFIVTFLTLVMLLLIVLLRTEGCKDKKVIENEDKEEFNN